MLYRNYRYSTKSLFKNESIINDDFTALQIFINSYAFQFKINAKLFKIVSYIKASV